MRKYTYPERVKTEIRIYVWAGPVGCALILAVAIGFLWPDVPIDGVLITLAIGLLGFPLSSYMVPYEIEVDDNYVSLYRVGLGRLVLDKSRILKVEWPQLGPIISRLARGKVAIVYARRYGPTQSFYVWSSISDFDELLVRLRAGTERLT